MTWERYFSTALAEAKRYGWKLTFIDVLEIWDDWRKQR